MLLFLKTSAWVIFKTDEEKNLGNKTSAFWIYKRIWLLVDILLVILQDNFAWGIILPENLDR
mgnify:CR=1 FL=1